MISRLPVRLQTIHVQTIKMKFRLLFVFIVLVPVTVLAADDPILFTVGDMPITRSEFEQSYLKTVKYRQTGNLSVGDFLESYIVYKLKVKAALDAHIDDSSDFRQTYAQCLTEGAPVQYVHTLSPDRLTASSSAVKAYYDRLKRNAALEGQICLSQIFIPVAQKASRGEQRRVQQRMDQIFSELQRGADFGQLARMYSQDELSAKNDGNMGWFGRGQLFKEIEDVAFGLRKGEMSRPFLSTIGYHILLMTDKKTIDRYDLLKDSLSAEVGRRQIHQKTTTSYLQGDIIEQREVPVTTDALMPVDPLQREYYEGLLLLEQSKQSVGRHAAEDEEALRYFFKKNKKKYRRKGFKPKDYTEVRDLVVADLQEEMNKHWIADLRERYPVSVNKKILKTVNKHH